MPAFPDTPDDIVESRYILSAHKIDQLPESFDPEIAFAGRSNVGKSSLINALIGRKNLARTSNTPGKTQALNVYSCGMRRRMGHDHFLQSTFRLVDLPGYGYAKVSKSSRVEWGALIEGYLREAALRNLWCVALVIDGRRDPMESDLLMADWLGQMGIQYIAVLTKTDKLNQSERAKMMRDTQGPLISLGARAIIPISATHGTGIELVWPALDEAGS